MAQLYHNPFAGIDLIAPVSQREAYELYCQTSGHTTADSSPFPRMVDLWFTGFCLAAREGRSPIDLSKHKTFKFIDGSILDSDSLRVQALMLVAIAIEDNVEVIAEPRRVIAIANGLAAAGVPMVVELLRTGDQEPIWNLSEALTDLFTDSA